MRKLILIKHARPVVDPAVSSEQWRLSDEGRARCRLLADALKPFDFETVVSSVLGKQFSKMAASC